MDFAKVQVGDKALIEVEVTKVDPADEDFPFEVSANDYSFWPVASSVRPIADAAGEPVPEQPWEVLRRAADVLTEHEYPIVARSLRTAAQRIEARLTEPPIETLKRRIAAGLREAAAARPLAERLRTEADLIEREGDAFTGTPALLREAATAVEKAVAVVAARPFPAIHYNPDGFCVDGFLSEYEAWSLRARAFHKEVVL